MTEKITKKGSLSSTIKRRSNYTGKRLVSQEEIDEMFSGDKEFAKFKDYLSQNRSGYVEEQGSFYSPSSSVVKVLFFMGVAIMGVSMGINFIDMSFNPVGFLFWLLFAVGAYYVVLGGGFEKWLSSKG